MSDDQRLKHSIHSLSEQRKDTDSNIQTSRGDCFKASRIDLHFILNSNFLETAFRRLIIIIDTPLLDH